MGNADDIVARLKQDFIEDTLNAQTASKPPLIVLPAVWTRLMLASPNCGASPHSQRSGRIVRFPACRSYRAPHGRLHRRTD